MAAGPGPSREREILLLADVEVGLDRIELRDRCEYGRGAYQIADLKRGLSGDAVDERSHFGEAQVELRGFDLCLGACNRGLGAGNRGLIRLERLGLVVQGALGDSMSLSQWGVALDIDLSELHLSLGLSKLSLGLVQLSLRLVERGLERPRIDLKEDLVLVDLAAFGVVLPDEAAGYLRLYLRVHISVGSRHPAADDRDRLGGGSGHLDRKGSLRTSRT